MNIFQPRTVEEALSFAQSPGAFYLAGGTDLILRMRKDKLVPQALIDLGKINELTQIEVREEDLVLGSRVTFDDCLRNERVREEATALWQACQTMGSPQIRHQATLGGNLGNCSPAADSLPPLLVLDTRVELISSKGREILPLPELLTRDPLLTPGTLIKAFYIPRKGFVSGFSKLGRRKALAISRLSAAVSLRHEQNKAVELKIALGAVGKRPFLLEELCRDLQGKVIDQEWINAACAGAQTLVEATLGTRPSAPYKKVAVAGVLRKALNQITLRVGRSS